MRKMAKVIVRFMTKEAELMKFIATLIQRFTKRMGIAACGVASQWGGNQIKEPKNIFKCSTSSDQLLDQNGCNLL